MLHKLVSKLDSLADFSSAQAHCDIPCKIYDPSTAQIAALTVIRMVDMIEDLEKGEDRGVAYQNTLSRLVAEKEEHGRRVKEEIRVIWGDYIKAPQIEAYPEIHELTHGIMMLASQAKQNVDRAKALELLEKVNRFAEIFWATKDVKTKRATCPYPPAQEVVYPDL